VTKNLSLQNTEILHFVQNDKTEFIVTYHSNKENVFVEMKSHESKSYKKSLCGRSNQMAQSLTLELSEALYERVKHAAAAMQQPLEKAVAHIIELGLPPLDAPTEFEPDLKALEALDDETLWEVLFSKVSPTTQRKLHQLLDKNQSGTLTERERLQLDALQKEADGVMLRKAHAAVLLKWRGHRIPTLEELRKVNKHR